MKVYSSNAINVSKLKETQ